MAVAHCLTFVYLNSSNNIVSIRTKPLGLASTRYSVFSRPTTKKNYLRQKILKTTKPYPLSIDPVVPTISEDKLRPNDFESEPSSNQIPAEIFPVIAGEVDRPEEHSEWETAESSEKFTGNVTEGTVIRFGAYLIGVFVVQTIFAVWMLRNPNSNQNNNSEGAKKTSRRELTVNGLVKVSHGNFDPKTENLVSIEDSVFGEKIEEIRAMAGAVREAEKRKESEGVGNIGIEDGHEISRGRYGIEKEIDAKLIKLQNRKTSSGEKLPDSYVNFFSNIGKVEDGFRKDDSENKEKNERLMFKKRHKFRNSSTELERSPKGFQGSKESTISKRKKKDSSGNGNTIDNGLERSVEASHGISISKAQESGSRIFGEDDGMNLTLQESPLPSDDDAKNLDKRVERSSEPNKGDISTFKAKSRKTKELRTTSSPGIMKGSMKTSKTSAKDAKSILSGNGTGRWWLNLPYVLVIFIRRSSDQEELGGLYTLKAQDQKKDSYTIAFEDRGDANNFCHLLESFFEELGDFSADIVPLSRKELYESVESKAMKIVVVKKGQIQLYVGQPFADVEMALHALIEQDQNMSSLDPRY